MIRKTLIKKLLSYIIIGNLVIYNFSNIVFGLSASIIYNPSGPTLTSGSVTATLTGDYDTIDNNGGSDTYVFNDTGSFWFQYSSGGIETGTIEALVTWIDKIAPSVTLTGNKIGYTNTGFTMTVDFSEEVMGFMDTGIIITNGTLNNFQTISGSQYTFDVTPTTGGIVTVDIAADQCTDLVGRGNTAATQFSIIYDNEAPTAYVEYSTTGDTNQDVIATITGFNETITNLNSGNYTFTNTGSFTFTFEDLAGNTGETTANVTRIDKIAPTAYAEFSTTGLINQDVTVTITGFSESITGLNVTGFVFTGNGDYEFTFQDIAGNTGTLTGTIRRIDKTPITGYVEYSTTGRTNTGVIATMTGFNKTGVTVSGGATFTFTENTGYIFYYTDIAGNTGETLASVTGIDMEFPTFIGAISGQSYSTGITITFTDNIGATATLNGSGYNSGDPITNEGTNIFVVTDLAGNSTGVIFIIDTIPPTATGYYSITGLTNQDILVTLTGRNETITGINFLNHIFTGNGSFEFTFSDLAGNTGNYIATVTNIDKSPVTGIITYDITGRTNGNVTATITGFNKTGVTITSSGTYTFVTNGTYDFTFIDAYGNTGLETATVTGIDTTLPIIQTGYIYGGNTGTNGSTEYYNGAITIRADVNDVGIGINTGSCEYTLDGTTRTSGNYISDYCYASINPATDISVSFRVKDMVENLNTGGTTSYIYDATPPTTTDNANSITGRVDVTVTLTPTDGGVGISGTFYCVDTLGTCTPTLSGTIVSVTGTTGAITHKYVRYYSVDKLNNTEATKTSVIINIDKETPTLTGTTTFSSNNSTNSGYAKVGNTITVIFQAHETLTGTPTMTISGGSLTTGTVTNIGGNNYSGTFVMKTTDVQGIIGFNIFMTDLVGNTGTIFASNTIIFDRTIPAGISITSPTNTTYFQGGMTRTITWNTGTEINFGPTSLVLQYSNDGWSTLHSVISTGTANNGSYTRTFPVVDSTMASVRILATDLAGNTANFTGNQFTLDSTQPTDVTITHPSGGEFFKGGSGYTITWSGGTDNFLSGKIIEYSTNGFFPGTTIFTDTMNSFSYAWTAPTINSSGVKLKITVVDRAGLNKVAETSAFYIDSTKPTLTFVDTNSNRRNTNATGTATANDTLAGLRTTGVLYRTDIQFDQYCNGGSTTVPVLSADGTGYVYACVMDKAGNVTTGVQMYKIDKTAPTVTMPADKIVNTGTTIDITVDGNVSGISGYTRTKLSGTGTVAFTTATIQDPIVSANTDGPYVLQVVVKDNANNVTIGTINFTRHTIAPSLSGGTVSVSNTTATYTFIGNEAGTIIYSGTCGNGSLTSSISGNNTTTFTLTNNTYSGCKLQVTDSAGNASSRLTIPTFTVNYTAPSGGGGGGGGGGIPICTDTQLMCSANIYVTKAGVYCQGGNLNKPCGTDVCVDGDYSGSPSDGLCKDPTKVEASTGTTSTGTWTTYTSPFNKELTDAYSYAYHAKITTVNNIQYADLNGILIRSHLAKMMSEYATKVLGKTPDTSRICVFSDIKNQTEEFKKYAILACQLGLMGLKTDGTPATIFNPDGQVTRAIFGTTLSRTIRGETYNGGSVRYDKHLKALQQSEVMVKIDKPFNRELRGYVMLMMMRADQKITKSSYLTFTSLRGQKIFVPKTSTSTTATTSSQFTATELDFIKNINKAYQFTEGYIAGQTSAGVKYLQYVLKAKQYYTGTINGINTTATVSALYQFQFDNGIVDTETDQGAGYLGPTTREKINPLLQKLLNP